MDKNVCVPLADGFEEIEAVTIIDVLRRAGARVVTVGLKKRHVTGSHNIPILADSVLAEEEEKNWDMVVLPGGIPGALNLAKDDRLLKFIDKTNTAGKILAAVCAGPLVLEKAGITAGKRVTIHPGWQNEIRQGKREDNEIVQDGGLITGRSCGAAMAFAFDLVRELYGPEKVQEINKSILTKI